MVQIVLKIDVPFGLMEENIFYTQQFNEMCLPMVVMWCIIAVGICLFFMLELEFKHSMVLYIVFFFYHSSQAVVNTAIL